MSKRCRICLCLKPRRDITEIEITDGSTKHSYEEIIWFCLDIKVEEDTKLGTKLCVKCHRKILDFYDFKTMAQINNNIRNKIDEDKQEPEVFLKDVEVKCEVDDGPHKTSPSNDGLHHEEILIDIKTEEIEQCDDDVQNEYLGDETDREYKEQSDDEASLTGNIKEEKENVLESNDDTPSIVVPSQKTRKASNTDRTCPQCDKIFHYKHLKRHLITHLPPEQRLNLKKNRDCKKGGFCKECGKMVNRLKEHMVMHLPEDIWQKTKKGAGLAGTCKVCGKTAKRLKKHMVTHLPEFQRKKVDKGKPKEKDKKGPVECLMCGREFVAQQYLDMHMKNLHLRPKKQCPLCGKKVNKLKMHMLTAHNRDQMRFECDWCGTRFAVRHSLEKHIAARHTNDRPFHCNDCDKKFIQKSTLVIHQRRVHLNIRPFLCQFCPRTFHVNAALKDHVRGAHTKERPFKCPECGKGFNTKHILQSHMDHVHTFVKNHACTACPKRYKTQMEVKRHFKEAHLKIKNFKCRFCDSCFYRSTHLNRHEYNIHLRAIDKTDN